MLFSGFLGELVGWLISYFFPYDNSPDIFNDLSLESSQQHYSSWKFTHDFTEFEKWEVHCGESLHYTDLGWHVQQVIQLFFMYSRRTIGVNSAVNFKHCVFQKSEIFIMSTIVFFFSVKDVKEKDYAHYE